MTVLGLPKYADTEKGQGDATGPFPSPALVRWGPAALLYLERSGENPRKVVGAVFSPGRSRVLATFLPKPVTHQATNTLWEKTIRTFVEGTGGNVTQSALQMTEEKNPRSEV